MVMIVIVMTVVVAIAAAVSAVAIFCTVRQQLPQCRGGGSTSSSSGVSSHSDSTSSTKAPEKEGFLAFLKGPEKEPEPPMPTDPVLKAIAQDFGLRKGIASNWIFLSLILDHKVRRKPTLSLSLRIHRIVMGRLTDVYIFARLSF